MLAVGVYSVPETSQHLPVVRTLLPIVSPYMLVTTQWQRWNLFGPDPLRRVTQYRIEVETDGVWTPVTTLTPATIPWWRRGDELKILRQLEQGNETIDPIRQRYLQAYCRPLGIAALTRVRMIFRTRVIPYYRSMEEVMSVPPSYDWQEREGVRTTCPLPDDPIAPIRFL